MRSSTRRSRASSQKRSCSRASSAPIINEQSPAADKRSRALYLSGKIMSRESILKKVQGLPSHPIAFQAQWDGDSDGWFVYFEAITEDGLSHHIGSLRYGSDLRLFNGQVPPWPEAVVAQQIGEEFAKRYGAEFYFPSPNHPEIDCPEWNERHLGILCRRCSIPLLPDSYGGKNGICHSCGIVEEQEQREAAWTDEERAGPRCHMCGNPATGEFNQGPACQRCVDKYMVSQCEGCGATLTSTKSSGPRPFCSDCLIQKLVQSLTETQKEAIRESLPQGKLRAMSSTMKIVGCSLYEARDIVDIFSQPTEK